MDYFTSFLPEKESNKKSSTPDLPIMLSESSEPQTAPFPEFRNDYEYPSIPPRSSSVQDLMQQHDYFSLKPKLAVTISDDIAQYRYSQDSSLAANLPSPPDFNGELYSEGEEAPGIAAPFTPLTPGAAYLAEQPLRTATSEYTIKPSRPQSSNDKLPKSSSVPFLGLGVATSFPSTFNAPFSGSLIGPVLGISSTMPNLHHRNSIVPNGGSLTPIEDLGLIIQTNLPDSTAYRFLIVDDNPINLRILERVLTKIFPHLRIRLVVDSTKVAKLIETESFDLVFLDIEMPVVDGVEITRHIRSQDELNRWGIVAVTTRVQPLDLVKYNRAGIDYTFSKPLSYNYDYLMDIITLVIKDRRNRFE